MVSIRNQVAHGAAPDELTIAALGLMDNLGLTRASANDGGLFDGRKLYWHAIPAICFLEISRACGVACGLERFFLFVLGLVLCPDSWLTHRNILSYLVSNGRSRAKLNLFADDLFCHRLLILVARTESFFSGHKLPEFPVQFVSL